jgi:hypothetical protein
VLPLWYQFLSRSGEHDNQQPPSITIVSLTQVPPSILAANSAPRITASTSTPESQENRNAAPTEYIQGVLLRRLQMRKRAGLFPTAIKATTGPHDMGSGHRRDGLTPLFAQVSGSPMSELSDGDDGEAISDTPPVSSDSYKVPQVGKLQSASPATLWILSSGMSLRCGYLSVVSSLHVVEIL